MIGVHLLFVSFIGMMLERKAIKQDPYLALILSSLGLSSETISGQSSLKLGVGNRAHAFVAFLLFVGMIWNKLEV